MSAPRTQKEWLYKSRPYVAQVVSVDAAAGKMTINLLGLHESYTIDTPTFGFGVHNVASSWSRYMPTKDEYLHVAFDTLNRPRFLGMVTYDARARADHGMYAEAAKYLGTTMRALQSGEYDLRSAGGAGYYFNRYGHATVEAGVVSIELDRDRLESVGNAGLWVRGGFGTEVRFGDVKRTIPPATSPSSVLPTPSSVATKEWRRIIGSNPAPGVSFRLEIDEVGDVRNDLGVVVIGSTGQPLRARRRLYDAAGVTPVYTAEVDVLGNVKVTLGATAAVGVTLEAPTTPLDVTAASASVRVAGEIQLAGGGGVVSDGVVLGEALSTWLQSSLSVLTAFGPSGPAIVPLIPGTQYSNTVKASV